MSVAWGRSSTSGRLRWARVPEVDLGHGSGSVLRGHVDQERQLDGVTVGEAASLEDTPVSGGLAGQGLDDARKLWEEEVDQRPGHELGHAAATIGGTVERAPVVRLHEADPVVNQQGPEEPGDEVGPEVGDVGVHEDEQVPGTGLEGCGHGLALPPAAVPIGDDRGSVRLGHGRGVVGGPVVDHEDLVDECEGRLAPGQLDHGPDHVADR